MVSGSIIVFGVVYFIALWVHSNCTETAGDIASAVFVVVGVGVGIVWLLAFSKYIWKFL